MFKAIRKKVVGLKNKEKKTTLFGHLTDLRRVFIVSLTAIIIGVLICYFFLREPLMAIAFDPIRRLGKEPIIIGVAEGFMVHLRLVIVAGIVIASPIVLWQIISFILPALYKHEKKAFIIFFFLSVILFATGIVFSYLYVLNFGLSTFLLSYSGGLLVMISADRYLSFLESFLLPFGLIFQLPLVTCLLSHLGLLTPEKLRRNRRYAALVILIIAMFLTPPDVLSQILLAVPMLALYEVSILFSVAIIKRKKAKQLAEYKLAKSIYPLE